MAYKLAHKWGGHLLMYDSIAENRKNAEAEFVDIVKSYMLPLFDVRGNLKSRQAPSANAELISIENTEDGDEIYFYPCVGTQEVPSPFYCKIGLQSSAALKRPAIHILRELLKVSEYEYGGHFSTKRYYGKSVIRQGSYKKRSLDLAFELGMCQWLTTRLEDAITLYTVISRMIDWSSRTYEGKNVPFGIIIDFEKTVNEGHADYLHFLMNDSSAVFTDGIFSGIRLDRNGKVVSFITRDTPHQNLQQEIFVPYQFADIAKHCVGTVVGVIVLTNGEILLIKNQSICFAKRGQKWVCFDWTRVYSNLRPYFRRDQTLSEQKIRENIRSIYCTMLDVSFSHTGGCLALVHPDKDEALTKGKIVVDRFDLYAAGDKPENMKAENKEKAEIISYLLQQPQHTIRSFFEIEKPLRREILSLDGATVVSLNGLFYCAGSIVAVSGGSSGGGRTAAAKQLAKFGVGIKISEDGYIEAYGIPVNEDGTLAPQEKSHIRRLFIFK